MTTREAHEARVPRKWISTITIFHKALGNFPARRCLGIISVFLGSAIVSAAAVVCGLAQKVQPPGTGKSRRRMSLKISFSYRETWVKPFSLV